MCVVYSYLPRLPLPESDDHIVIRMLMMMMMIIIIMMVLMAMVVTMMVMVTVVMVMMILIIMVVNVFILLIKHFDSALNTFQITICSSFVDSLFYPFFEPRPHAETWITHALLTDHVPHRNVEQISGLDKDCTKCTQLSWYWYALVTGMGKKKKSF